MQDSKGLRQDNAPLGDDYGARAWVAADMEEIFSPLPRPANPHILSAADDPMSVREEMKRRRGPMALLLGLLLLGVLLLALAIGMLWWRDPGPRSAPVVAQPVVAVRHAVAPSIPAVLPTADKPLAQAPRVYPIQRVEDQKPAKREFLSPRDEKPVVPKPKPTPTLVQCAAAGGSEAWCLRGDSAAADARLRDAYDAAVRAHVDRRTLVGITKQWARLRKQALKDPAMLISGYAALTEELGRETRVAAPK